MRLGYMQYAYSVYRIAHRGPDHALACRSAGEHYAYKNPVMFAAWLGVRQEATYGSCPSQQTALLYSLKLHLQDFRSGI